jgi:adenine/guanine phosphoribosyltransferase-like PRPP-binding protein
MLVDSVFLQATVFWVRVRKEKKVCIKCYPCVTAMGYTRVTLRGGKAMMQAAQ